MALTRARRTHRGRRYPSRTVILAASVLVGGEDVLRCFGCAVDVLRCFGFAVEQAVLTHEPFKPNQGVVGHPCNYWCKGWTVLLFFFGGETGCIR